MDQTIRVWNSETQQTFLLRGHTDWINSVRIDEASRTLFSASDDLTVRLWDLDTRECIRVFEGHVGQVQQVLPLPAEFELDERIPSPLATAAEKDDDASSVASGSAPAGYHGFQDPLVRRDTPSPDEEDIRPFWDKDPDRPAPPRYMLTGALDATIRLWDVHFNSAHHLPGNAPSPPGPGHDEDDIPAPDPAAAGPQGRGSIPFRMLPTDPLTNSHTPRAQACVRTFFGHVEGIWALAADHLRLISGSEDRMMKVWDPRTGKCERTFTGHQGPVTCCWLSDWGVASGSEDCEVRMLVFGEM
jgi:F-box/WD-40 domain protein MET30